MTTPEHHPYVGCRLELPSLRGEVTVIATHLRDSGDLTWREQAAAWICATLDETAHVVDALVDSTPEQRARLVEELQAASEALEAIEVGDDDGG
ncbi:hypothetical protein [Saccharopolyspora tripterygii]